jgi:biopolymer transport protein ExbD
MPIHKPGSRLFESIKLRGFRGPLSTKLKTLQSEGGGHKSIHTELNLTPMIDMFSMLVTFLLQTFSSSGEILFMREDIRLPEAQNWTDLARSPVIGISMSAVTIDAVRVVDTDQLRLQLANPQPGQVPFAVPELISRLEVLRNNAIGAVGKEKFTGEVIVQAHKEVDFPIVWMVLYSSAASGYQNVSFAVLSTGPGAAAVAP